MSSQTPIKDLMEDALKHYDEISTKAHHWNSDIPKAIKHYYNHLEQQSIKEKSSEYWNEIYKKYLSKPSIIIEPLPFQYSLYKNCCCCY